MRKPPQPPIYILYEFNIEWSKKLLPIVFPTCKQLVCDALLEYHRGCDVLCSTSAWKQVNKLLRTVLLGYERAVKSIHARHADFAALLDTHIATTKPGQVFGASPRSSINVLAYHEYMSPQILSEVEAVVSTQRKFSTAVALRQVPLDCWKLWKRGRLACTRFLHISTV